MQPLPPREISGFREAELRAAETKAGQPGWDMLARKVALEGGITIGEGGLAQLLLGTRLQDTVLPRTPALTTS